MNKQKLAKWRRWLETIRTDVGNAYLARTIHRDVIGMVHRNPAVDRASLFFAVFTSAYVDSLVMAIRRQVKPQGISLFALLTDIAANAGHFTRAWFYDSWRHHASGNHGPRFR